MLECKIREVFGEGVGAVGEGEEREQRPLGDVALVLNANPLLDFGSPIIPTSVRA